jgi:hypothetical protein
LPVVNSFFANPDVITAGNSSQLSWSVSNAAMVTIVPGVGAAPTVGSTLVSPAATTNYTLTATNAVGSYNVTIQIVVVAAPPPVPQTIILTPVLNETGAVYSAVHSPVASTLAGDAGDDTGIRAYFSFNIASLAGKNVTNAKLTFTTQNIVSNPWPDLIGLWVGTVEYGIGPLQSSDYNLASTPLIGSWLTSPPVTIDATSAVHSAVGAGKSRFQVRAHFAKATDSDHVADYIMWSTATLTVTYVP